MGDYQQQQIAHHSSGYGSSIMNHDDRQAAYQNLEHADNLPILQQLTAQNSIGYFPSTVNIRQQPYAYNNSAYGNNIMNLHQQQNAYNNSGYGDNIMNNQRTQLGQNNAGYGSYTANNEQTEPANNNVVYVSSTVNNTTQAAVRKQVKKAKVNITKNKVRNGVNGLEVEIHGIWSKSAHPRNLNNMLTYPDLAIYHDEAASKMKHQLYSPRYSKSSLHERLPPY
jgi:hypothetical protein